MNNKIKEIAYYIYKEEKRLGKKIIEKTLKEGTLILLDDDIYIVCEVSKTNPNIFWVLDERNGRDSLAWEMSDKISIIGKFNIDSIIKYITLNKLNKVNLCYGNFEFCITDGKGTAQEGIGNIEFKDIYSFTDNKIENILDILYNKINKI